VVSFSGLSGDGSIWKYHEPAQLMGLSTRKVRCFIKTPFIAGVIYPVCSWWEELPARNGALLTVEELHKPPLMFTGTALGGVEFLSQG